MDLLFNSGDELQPEEATQKSQSSSLFSKTKQKKEKENESEWSRLAPFRISGEVFALSSLRSSASVPDQYCNNQRGEGLIIINKRDVQRGGGRRGEITVAGSRAERFWHHIHYTIE